MRASVAISGHYVPMPLRAWSRRGTVVFLAVAVATLTTACSNGTEDIRIKTTLGARVAKHQHVRLASIIDETAKIMVQRHMLHVMHPIKHDDRTLWDHSPIHHETLLPFKLRRQAKHDHQ